MNLIYTSIELAPSRRARKTDPSTSQASAKRAEAFAGSHAGRILSVMQAWQVTDYVVAPEMRGCTAGQISGMTGLLTHQILKRLPEMQKSGLIHVIQHNGADLERNGFRCWAIGEAK